MSSAPSSSVNIQSVAELVSHFAAGEKPSAVHRLGVEHEKIGVLPGGVAPPFAGVIERLLDEVAQAGGWERVLEGDQLIALRRSDEAGAASVTLEPGGQIELSDAPRASARDAERRLKSHLRELAGPARALDLCFLGIGFRPFGTLDDVPWMPKGRYRVMRAYLPTRGAMAHEMMKRTATVQVNIDYTDQADCARKLRAAMGVSSLMTALFAASPLVDGRATDYQSYRAATWLDTDNDRCGLLDFVFDPDEAAAAETLYARYAEWALDVPMFFVQRGGEYRPAAGMTFRRFLSEGFEGGRATHADWELHLSTLFPEVRLKRYLEIRGADAGPLEMVVALPALVRGLLHEPDALAAAWELVRHWSFEERQQLRRDLPRAGLRARVGAVAIADLAAELVRIARAGLVRLGGEQDVPLLEPLARIASTGRTVADELRDLHRRTGGDPDAITQAIALKLD